MSAVNILEKAASHLKDRAATYDKPEGERSIGAAVEAFNAVTGDGLMNTGERGWLFMAILKMVRSQQGNYRADNYEDLAAYSALMGEAACEERNGSWTDHAIKQAAFKSACEYTLDDVIGDAELSDWARWVIVNSLGYVFEFERHPYFDQKEWRVSDGYCGRIRKINPPLNHQNCIWEVNVKPDCEYTLEQVIGDAELSDWARWVAVGPNGHVCEFQDYPDRDQEGWIPLGGDWNYMRGINPPLNCWNCIWEVKN